jgi:hypothetical protein
LQALVRFEPGGYASIFSFSLIDLGVWLDEAYRVPANEDGNVP